LTILRRTLAPALCALALTSGASAATLPVSIFYYPWYSTAQRDGSYVHWAQRGHAPPFDIASGFYPARGLYSSADVLVVGAQMQQIASMGVGEVAVSWWGRGSMEDARLPLVLAGAKAYGLSVAIHIEPYGGRSAETVGDDIAYLTGLGVHAFYVYQPQDTPAVDWAAMNDSLEGVTVLAQTGLAGLAAAGHFDGLYTYDLLNYGGATFRRICAYAHKKGLLCAPSVGPGYDARRGSGDLRVKPRRNGATYDAMWGNLVSSGADGVTITSFNEWHEGTQIEPAASTRRHGAYRYATYDGAWGKRGPDAETAYVDRTAWWVGRFALLRDLGSMIRPS
jgi:glycoprotein endo-alpha-1,2-mannosidase